MTTPLRLPAAVRVPASSANLGPGFDVLGLALEIYLHVRVGEAQAGVGGLSNTVRLCGRHTDDIATDESNLPLAAFRRAFERAGRAAPAVCLEIENDIPLARGLGSSGAAALAGIALANYAGRLGFSPFEMIAMAAEFEGGHPDNVAASYLGGLTVACALPRASEPENAPDRVVPAGPPLEALSFPWPREIGVVIAVPECLLETSKARAALPGSYSRADVVFNLQRLALLVGGLAGPQPSAAAIAAGLADRLHQPHRAPLVPGLNEALALRAPGLLGVALSGAGPSLIAFVKERAEPAVEALRSLYASLGLAAEVSAVGVDNYGAMLVQESGARSQESGARSQERGAE